MGTPSLVWDQKKGTTPSKIQYPQKRKKAMVEII
jgi:hypothetical protein